MRPGFNPAAQESSKFATSENSALLDRFNQQFLEWLKRSRKLDSQEYDLAEKSYMLMRTFIEGLNRASEQKPIVIVLDTYELLDSYDAWLRHTLQLSGPRLLWIISGREGEDFLRRYRNTFAEELLAEMHVNVFAQGELLDYLKVQNVLPDAEEAQNALVETVQDISQGIPLAVEALVNLRREGVDISHLFDDMRGQQLARREVVRRLTIRFLKWCDESGVPNADERILRSLHRQWIQTLALLGRDDRTALAALSDVIQPGAPLNPDALLQELEERYSFVFAQEKNRMHDLVREILREDLRTEPSTYRLHRVAEVAADYYAACMVTLEAKHGSDRATAVCNKDWQEAALGLLNARYWMDKHGRKGMETFVPLAIEAHFFSEPLFLVECLRLAAEFATKDSHDWITYARWEADGLYREPYRNPTEETIALWDDICQNATNYRLSPLQKAISRLRWGQMLHGQGQYEKALAAYQCIDDLTHVSPASFAVALAEELRRTSWELCVSRGQAVASPSALQAVQRAIALDKNSAEAWHTYGAALQGLGQHNEALQALREAIRLKPNSAYLRNSLAGWYSPFAYFGN
jgi:tetratricopeptide (TPR) repeat protein